MLSKIKEKALQDHIPIIMDDTLEEIRKILIEQKPENLLEIGTAVGYSAICFSEYVPQIDTIELDQDRAKQAIENIKIMNLQDEINVIQGDAVEVLPTLTKKYDIIFIDASKGKYPIFLENALNLISKNGVIIADNVLYKGYVLGDYNKHKQRTAVNRLREFLKTAEENPKINMQLLEVGDGLAILRKQ